VSIIHGDDEDTLRDYRGVTTTRFGDARGRARVFQDDARVFFFVSVFFVFFVFVGDSSG